MAACLDESTVLAFLEGTLLPAVREDTEAHLAACRPCTELVMLAATDRENGSLHAPGREGRPFVGQIQPGTRWGRYQVLGAIGRGGMGEVYAAYHPDLDRRIALKVVYERGSDTVDRRARLLREARAIARLSHPNVVTVHDAGTFEDRVFIAMEYIDGTTVDEWLRAAPRTWREILDVFIAAGRGLAAAHAADVIHRDFMPQNIMIARNGAVRVMDFGLARMGEEETGENPRDPERAPDPARAGALMTMTKTGALLGTPAYMSPEQFHRERIDARTDQYSFCVALHEALFGARPRAVPVADRADAAGEKPPPPRPAGVPGWLRAVILRGASVERAQRYRSMDALIAKLERGRTRVRRRATVAAVAVATVLLSAGAFRLGYGNRFACAVPKDRADAVWAAGDAQNPRRQAIHGAFAASRRPTAETSWERLSRVLDDYMTDWNAMYLQACEATHVRGEQSSEVLGLRMSCLYDNLDQVRALTDALKTADAAMLSQAVTSARDLTPVTRCADMPSLRSNVSLPKDERTLQQVNELRSSLRDLEVRRGAGDGRRLLERAQALRPAVEELGYKPLLGELLELIGYVRLAVDADMNEAEATLREALVTADASRDDIVAAKAAVSLSFLLGYRLGRLQEAEFMSQMATAFLDRLGPGNERIRGWAVGNQAVLRSLRKDFDGARALTRESIALKEKALGPEHPDVAIGLNALAFMSNEVGHPDEGLVAADRAVNIFVKNGDPDGVQLAATLATRGDSLNALGRYAEAESTFERSLRIFNDQSNPMHPEVASACHGLGETRLGQGKPADAIPLLERALRICEPDRCNTTLVGDTKFALARALWATGGNQAKAHALATEALDAHHRGQRTDRERTVAAWLTTHHRS